MWQRNMSGDKYRPLICKRCLIRNTNNKYQKLVCLGQSWNMKALHDWGANRLVTQPGMWPTCNCLWHHEQRCLALRVNDLAYLALSCHGLAYVLYGGDKFIDCQFDCLELYARDKEYTSRQFCSIKKNAPLHIASSGDGSKSWPSGIQRALTPWQQQICKLQVTANHSREQPGLHNASLKWQQFRRKIS